jgi:uncharacterized protein (TIGR03067 family)
MWRCLVVCFSLIALLSQPQASADDKADELKRLAGKYTAEFSARTGQPPADKEVLKTLTLEINKDEWIQNFRGDVAPYTISLDLTAEPKEMRLTHKNVQAVRDFIYDLKGDTLTVTEQLGPDAGLSVTIWKRTRAPIN